MADSGADWQSLFEQANRLHARGEHVQAEQVAQQALQKARDGRGFTQPYIASSLNLLALARHAQGHGEEAVALLREALAMNEQSLGTHANTALVAMNLGHVLDTLGRPKEAITPYERSLALAEALLDQKPGDVDARTLRQSALSALAQTHTAPGQHDQANTYNQRLLAEMSGLSPTQRADALTRQAEVQQARGLDEEAMALHRQAIEQRLAVDPEDPALAVHYNELALWHVARQEDAVAQTWFEKALALIQRGAGGGPSSMGAAHVIGSLGQLAEHQGQAGQARSRYQEAFAIYDSMGDSPDALLGRARSLNQLAALDFRQRRWADVEGHFLQALHWLERAVGTRDPILLPVLDNLANYYAGRSQLVKSQGYARRAREIRQREVLP